MPLRYITQQEAQKIDEELMSEQGAYSLDQLMELAGLACAQTLAECYPLKTHSRVMVICGPGNQGGDGLVAARHLHMFGYKPVIYMPKPGKKDIYLRLTKQCQNLGVSLIESEEEFEKKMGVGHTGGKTLEVDVVLDAIFGFSFHPPVRAPFTTLLNHLSTLPIPIVSVDIPSGWDVESGPPSNLRSDDGESVGVIWSDALISLTACKEGVRAFGKGKGKEGKKGRHFLGGRFVPESLEKKYQLELPKYPGYQQIVEITDLQ